MFLTQSMLSGMLLFVTVLESNKNYFEDNISVPIDAAWCHILYNLYVTGGAAADNTANKHGMKC